MKKILFVTAHSIDSAPAGSNEEMNAIVDLKGELSSCYANDYEFLPATNITEEELLSKIKKLKPYIFHFSGHGINAGEPLLYNGFTIDPEAFGRILKNVKEIKCVFLNSCDSFNILDKIGHIVEYSIVVKNKIPIESAIQFAKTFYENLFQGQPIYVAFDRTIDDLTFLKKHSFKPVLKLKNYFIMEKIIFENQDLFNRLPEEIHEQVKDLKNVWNNRNVNVSNTMLEQLLKGHTYPLITNWYLENLKILSKKIAFDIVTHDSLQDEERLARQIETYFICFRKIIVNMDGKVLFDRKTLKYMPNGYEKTTFLKSLDLLVKKAEMIFQRDQASIYFFKNRVQFFQEEIKDFL
jgi:hypothetical protein